MTRLRAFALLLLAGASGIGIVSAGETGPVIGETENTYTLSSENTRVSGVAFDDVSPEAPRLFVLDRSRKVFCYKLDQKPEEGIDELELVEARELPKREDGSDVTGPRGLAFAVEGGRGVLYFLNWVAPDQKAVSELWRVSLSDGRSRSVDLSLHPFRIGDRETLGVAHHRGRLFVCFDASGYADHDLRVHRGIIQLKWSQSYDQRLEFTRHMPDSGHEPSRALACMQLDGAQYIWGAVGDNYIYCADARTGRGLFHFARPTSRESTDSSWGLAYGAGSLWVAENVEGAARIHRVNATKNLDRSREGPRSLRRLVMTIEAAPEKEVENAGRVYHNYSRPYSYDQLHNQGVWPDTETLTDTAAAPNASLRSLTSTLR